MPTLATYLNIGVDFEYMWIVLAVLCGALLWSLIYLGVGISTRIGVVLGIIEIAIFVMVSAVLIVNAGADNTVAYLSRVTKECCRPSRA